MMRRTTICIAALAVWMFALALAPATAAQVDDHRKIQFKDLPAFKIPRPEVFTLDNGMTVFLMQDTELPLISVNARIRSGGYYEPAEKTGLAGIFGQVQREGGTNSMEGDAINDFLEDRAASVETGMTFDFGTAGMNCLKEDFDEVFAVFNDVLRKPAFSEDKLELAKVQTKTFIARRNDDAAAIATREFNRAVYGANSPLGRLTEYATVDAIETQDLKDWHRRFYHPNNVYLGVLGDFDSKAMRKKIEAAYADWKRGPAAPVPVIEVPGKAGGIYFVPRDDVTQANIRMGHEGIRVKDPDYFAAQVMNEVLSGGFAARLFSNIRTKRGLAYNVGGGIGSAYAYPGLFQTSMSTKSETMAESVEALREQIEGMIAQPVTDEELRRAKESILNSFVFNYDQRAEILQQQMAYAFNGLPKDFLESYRDRIEQVTKADVMTVAKKRIHPDRLVLVVVGNPAEFDRPVGSFGDVQEVDIAIAPPADSAPKVEATAANLELGRLLFGKMSQALGAGSPLESMTTEFDLALDIGGQQISMGQKVTVVLPDKIRQSMTTPMGEQVVVVNGKSGIISAGGQKQPAPATMVSDSIKGLSRDLLVMAAAVGDPGLKTVAVPSDSGSGDCTMVAVTLNDTDSRICVGGDGRVLRQIYQGKHPVQQTPGTIEIVYSDWESMGGALVPKTRVMHFDGKPVATLTVKSMTINGKPDPALFAVE